MIDLGKHNLLGVLVDAVDYAGAANRILNAAAEGVPYGATALAVQGVMTGQSDKVHRYRLNALDLVTPDGQPVRWGLNMLHATRLPERVYGPTLMLEICRRASDEGLPVYLYGSREEVLDLLLENLRTRFPMLVIA